MTLIFMIRKKKKHNHSDNNSNKLQQCFSEYNCVDMNGVFRDLWRLTDLHGITRYHILATLYAFRSVLDSPERIRTNREHYCVFILTVKLSKFD